MTLARWVGIALVVGTFTGGTAQGTTVRALSNKSVAETADVIATGGCVDVRSAWQGRTLVTIATIAVTETLKGDASPTLTVTLPGGVDLNRKFPIAAVYPGAPQISLKEDVFLFLSRRHPANDLTIVGFSQGKFSIAHNARGEQTVSRNLAPITVESPAGARQGAASQVALDAFKHEIRAYLRAR